MNNFKCLLNQPRCRSVKQSSHSHTILPPVKSSLVNPLTIQTKQHFELEGKLPFAATSIIGKRTENEDAELQFETPDFQLFGVFDGHGGFQASNFCKDNLQKIFLSFLQQCDDSLTVDAIIKVLQQTVQTLHSNFISNAAFAQIGTTISILVYLVKPRIAVVCHVGDSRVLVGYAQQLRVIPNAPAQRLSRQVSRSGVRFFATEDHKPSCQKERVRLQRDFPSAEITCSSGVMRINGILSLSRAMGDYYMSTSGVVCQPDFSIIEEQFSYILIACDGFFDAFSNEEADEMIRTMQQDKLEQSYRNQGICEIALYYFRGLEYKADQLWRRYGNFPTISTQYDNVDMEADSLKRISQVLTKMAFQKGSTDNVSVIVISGNVI